MVFQKPKHVIPLLLGLVLLQLISGSLPDLTASSASAAPAPTPPDKTVFSTYKGVGLGMKADEARKLLGSPKDKSEAQDFYVISDNETVQVFYEGNAVTAISIDFAGDLKTAPTAKAVLGEEVAAKPDGGVYKLVRYPKAGYWVSYSRTGGSSPIVSITIQKM